MSELFDFFEPDENDKILKKYSALKINNSPSFYLIIRGITGNLKLKQNYRNYTFNVDQNLLLLTKEVIVTNEINEKKMQITAALKNGISDMLDILHKRCKSDLEIIPSYLSDSFTMQDLQNAVTDKRLVQKNKVFFDYLNDEYCNYYYFSKTENHTAAFIHLYRILEYISYTFPVLYAIKTKDFSKSYDSLKSLFSGEKDKGELRVFKKFISSIITSEKSYEKLSIDIHILSQHSDCNKRIYETIVNVCDNSFFEATKTKINSKVSVKFSEYASFMITIRNRFFHLKNSEKHNIKSVDIVDSELFFSLINKQSAYFLSLITMDIIQNTFFTE